MNDFDQMKIFYAVLNMGLGHATRSLPLIREFIRRNAQVYIGSSGRALLFLRQEVPEADFIELPDYGLDYTARGVEIGRILRQVPRVIRTISKERQITAGIVEQHGIDLVISDHRYGCYAQKAPSFFISHQLRFIAPPLLRRFEFVGAQFNRWFHRKYDGIIVPDEKARHGGVLSGRLSEHSDRGNYFFPGILSSITRWDNPQEDIDVLISVSGPEPQRTAFEKIVRTQVAEIPGKKVVVLGMPESHEIERPEPDILILHHADRKKMKEFYNRGQLIVARSGYSTIMELAELGKKALFVPTPGQTEQIYLAERFREKGWFYSVEQGELDLKKDIPLALGYAGFQKHYSTKQSLDNIFKFISESFSEISSDTTAILSDEIRKNRSSLPRE